MNNSKSPIDVKKLLSKIKEKETVKYHNIESNGRRNQMRIMILLSNNQRMLNELDQRSNDND